MLFPQNTKSIYVARFYGAVSERTMRPEVSYQDLRDADGNSGDVEENKSLYWNPAIYKVRNPTSKEKSYELVSLYFASAYYVWRTGQATAFPNGLKMRALGAEKLSRAVCVCDASYDCERDDEGGCDGYQPSNQEQHGFLPLEGCGGDVILFTCTCKNYKCGTIPVVNQFHRTGN